MHRMIERRRLFSYPEKQSGDLLPVSQRGTKDRLEWADTQLALNGEINVDYSQRGPGVKAGTQLYELWETGSIFGAISKVIVRRPLDSRVLSTARRTESRISSIASVVPVFKTRGT